MIAGESSGPPLALAGKRISPANQYDETPTGESSCHGESGKTGVSLGATSDIDDIFRQYLDPVYRFIFRQVGNQQDAEDLTSEVFLTAARNLDLERPEKAIVRWLFTVSRTVVADHWRRHYRVPPLVDIDDLQVASMDPVRAVNEKTDQASGIVARVLDALPDRYRQVLELRFLRGYSLKETAEELGLTLENVKITQHRALAKAIEVAEELT